MIKYKIKRRKTFDFTKAEVDLISDDSNDFQCLNLSDFRIFEPQT